MEGGILVAKSVLTSSEFTEVLGRLWDDIVVELEDDAADRLAVDGNIKLIERDYRNQWSQLHGAVNVR